MSLIIDVKVVPQSGKQLFKLDKTGRLTCYLKSAPERGLANKELIKFIAKVLSIPLASIEIVAGKTSRNKRVRLKVDIKFEHLLQQLGIEQQLELFNL